MGLEEAEEFGLELRADLGDLVEEERPAGGGADDPVEGLVGAGERPLAIAEQLALEHLARDRRAVEGDERLRGAARRAMDRPREYFLAGAGLAGEQDGDVGGRDALGDGEQLGHLLGHPEPAVGLEGVGGPQRRTLLLFAPVAVDGDGRVDELPDRDAGAAIVESRAELGDDLPGLVAVLAAGYQQPVAGFCGDLDRLGFGPPAGGDETKAVLSARDERHRLRRTAQFQQRVRFACQHVGVAGELKQCDRVVEVLQGWTQPQGCALILEVRCECGILNRCSDPSPPAVG